MTHSLRRGLVLIALLFSFSSVVTAESEGPVAQLKPGDVKHFLDTMPKMIKELKKLGDDYGKVDDPSALQEMLANEKAQEILERYGWNKNDYLTKITTIASAYGAMTLQDELASLPSEQRAMMESIVGMQMSQLIMAHANDIKLVRANKAELEAFFESQ